MDSSPSLESQAQADAARLRDMIMGFRVTQMLHVAAKLNLADQLADGPQSAESVAADVGADPAALRRFMRALTSIVGGDFFSELPSGGDVYLLKSVLHNWADGDAERILRCCRRAMPRHARLLVAERIVPPGNAPSEAKLFDINMLVVVGGRERTEEEYRELLDRAGFALVQVIATKSPLSVIDGQPLAG